MTQTKKMLQHQSEKKARQKVVQTKIIGAAVLIFAIILGIITILYNIVLNTKQSNCSHERPRVLSEFLHLLLDVAF